MPPRNTDWRRLPDAVTSLFFLSGLWLAASPYILDFAWHPAAWWNAVVIGVALVALALVRFAYPRRFEGLRWTVLILGAWIVASPYVANYNHVEAATWNAIVIGILTIFTTLAAAARPATRPA